MSRPGDAEVLVRSLRDCIDGVLSALIAPGQPVALLDFPSYPNVGDSAIWLGELAWLAGNGSEIVHVATHRDYSAPVARRRIGSMTILLSGGGNLGDAYPWHQRLRERVIGDFPRNRVIQLPQSATFAEPAARRRAAAVFERHDGLTVLARDQSTLELCADLGAEVLLCPDMAFCLGLQRRPADAAAGRELLALLRADRQSALRDRRLGDVQVVDWIAGHGPADGRLLRRAIKPLELISGRLPPLGLVASGGLARAYDHHARLRLRAGLRLLGGAGALITDRLHAGILAFLLGIPTVLLDDTTGKLAGFHATWLDGYGGCRFARPENAVELARTLSGGPGSPERVA